MNEGKKIGPIIGAFIIVVLLIVAAIYIWGQRLNKTSGTADQTATSGQQTAENTQPRNDAGATMSTSDDADALGNDLNSTGNVDVTF